MQQSIVRVHSVRFDHVAPRCQPPMRRAMLFGGLIALALPACASQPTFPPEIAKWKEVSMPPDLNQGARAAWLYAANYSKHEWRVLVEKGQVRAQLVTAKVAVQRELPRFTPKVGRYRNASSYVHVDDGWLVGFNQGEFGAALYWFSHDGTQNYKVSSHQVVDFFPLSGDLHAIEGLAHMGSSDGSVIRITRPSSRSQWEASAVTKLPFAPYAISVRRDNTMLVTLSDSLVSVGANYSIATLLENPPWDGLYPNSSALSPDEQKLYIGMRQFVGEFDLSTKRLRLLIPSDAFINKLPKEDEQRIRKQYGG